MRTLSNRELVRYASIDWDTKTGLPIETQRELLRRFAALAPMNEQPAPDYKQLDLFLPR